jgi:hypothetical protein
MYLGSPTTAPDGSRLPPVAPGPQAHLAVQGPGTEPLRPHFHGVDQFQFFVAGAGSVGAHEVEAGVVHYADRNSVYGPLRPGPTGMAYATLRPSHDPGASFMPGAREELAARLRARPGPRRNFAVHLPPGGNGWQDVAADDDGLRIAVCALAPRATAPVTVGGAGAYVAVVDGAVAADGRVAPRGAVAWCPPGQAEVVAGDGGATVALLQFPAEPAA